MVERFLTGDKKEEQIQTPKVCQAVRGSWSGRSSRAGSLLVSSTPSSGEHEDETAAGCTVSTAKYEISSVSAPINSVDQTKNERENVSCMISSPLGSFCRRESKNTGKLTGKLPDRDSH
jgi:hypothetical protein